MLAQVPGQQMSTVQGEGRVAPWAVQPDTRGGVYIWPFGWIVTPTPRLRCPNLDRSDLHQQFHWRRSEQSNRAPWGLPQAKGINIPLLSGELQLPPTQCKVGGQPVPTQVRTGLAVRGKSAMVSSCCVFPCPTLHIIDGYPFIASTTGPQSAIKKADCCRKGQ